MFISYGTYLNVNDYSVIVNRNKLVAENSGNQDIYVLNDHYGVSSSRYDNSFGSKILDYNDMVNKIIYCTRRINVMNYVLIITTQ